ncbi:MAG TPA: hypothetical protein VHA70_11370 [Bauldia sp.]|nr:hypothetical protein [Bauldia sp.]
MRRFLKRLARLAAIVVAAVILAAGIAIASIEFGCRPTSPVTATADRPLVTDEGYRRIEANTYFTFPEWYIVYSFEDFGRFLETKSESQFPYLSQIGGFWTSYCANNRIAAGLPGDHFEYKMMIYVIGLSYTFEFLIKGAYENTIGRITEWLRGPTPTAEDNYARRVVQDYGAFLNQIPWYQYPFMDKLRGLWRETPFVGPSPVRSVERKLSLSAEYLVKAGYARLIALGLAATSDPAELEIMFVIDGDPAAILAREPKVRLIRMMPENRALLIAPRYQEFTELLERLADQGVNVIEIAGNHRILMSAIVRSDSRPAITGARELFSLPVDARPGFVRVGYDVDVPALATVLSGFSQAGAEVEHLYDY